MSSEIKTEKPRMKGRLIVNMIDDPESVETKVILEAEGEVLAIDALIGFGKVLDRVINGPVQTRARETWRRAGEDFDQGVRAGAEALAGAPDIHRRSNRQAGLLRAVIDDILKSSDTTFVIVGRNHVDS
jgi:hypothetical protein